MSNTKMRKLPPQDYLWQCFNYREDGTLVWKERPPNHYKTLFGHKMSTLSVGKIAGCKINNGYYVVGISYLGKQIVFALHRVIWTMHYGEIPDGYLVDHKDTNPSNNRIANLRLATHSNNSHNAKLRPDNTSGFKCVSWCKAHEKWHVGVELFSKCYNLGYYDKIEDAVAAAESGRQRLHQEFANHG